MPKTLLQHTSYSDEKLSTTNILRETKYGRYGREAGEWLNGALDRAIARERTATYELRKDETYRHVPLLATNGPTLFLHPLFPLPLHSF